VFKTLKPTSLLSSIMNADIQVKKNLKHHKGNEEEEVEYSI
jgi:hypothetical protein